MRLRLQAFGPFANSQTVDFFRVLKGGLFLIHGRTGAGKTSLLDGLCFSLFGRPSTAEREKDLRALRSDLSDSGTPTETELIFTVGEEAFRVHRIPTQLVPKKRGEGFTELKGSAELWRFHSTLPNDEKTLNDELSKTENWIPVASKLESVDREIEALLGMNERQFRQVVILPQGKFREFLSSTSAERQTILERLFQTDRFSRLQSFFANHVRELESQWKSQSQEIEIKLKSLGLSTFDEIPLRLTKISDTQNEKKKLTDSLRSNLVSLREHLKLSEDLEVHTNRLSSLEQQTTELDSLSPSVQKEREKVALFDELSQYRTIDEQFHRGENQRLELQSRISATLKNAELAGQKVNELKSRLEKERETRPTLAELKVEYQKLRELFPILNGLQKEAQSISDERKLWESRQKDWDARTRANGKAEREITEAYGQLRHFHEINTKLENEHFLLMERKVSELELSYHQSEAARIAKRLSANVPCPVCGSTDHPHPAIADEKTAVEISTLKAQQASLAALRQSVSKKITERETSLSALHRLLESLKLASSLDDKSAATNVTDFSAIASQAENKALELLKSRQELSTLQANLKEAFVNLQKRDQELATRIDEIPKENQSLENVVARGSSAKKEIESRELFLEKATTELSLLESQLSNLQGIQSAQGTELQALTAEVQRLSQERSNEITKVGTKHPGFDILKWSCSLEERERLQKSVREFETKVIQNQTAKQECAKRIDELKSKFHAVGSRSSNDLKNEVEALSAELQVADAEVTRLAVEAENLDRLYKSVDSDRKRLDRLKLESERAIRINGLLSGDRTYNKLAVPLARFVLQSRFEDVLDQANRRLGRMSRGRYLLHRPALSRNLAQSQGLNLSVEDSMTGKERHADSLSGGESFMAALSLALGLADVVQSDLGGVKIDSVIIDEGFGTLDSESLDLALRTLVDLQAGGRMVGVISHVQELKSQIDLRLEVIPSPEGSSIHWEGD